MKRLYALLMAVVMVALYVAPASAQHAGLKVTFNGRLISFDVPPMIESGRTLVPFRAIFEKMGANVGYDANTRQITATRGSTTIRLTIGNNTASVNGRNVTLDVPPKIVNDRTVVPLRFVGEALGAGVNYNGAEQLISIRDSAYPVRGGTLTMGLPSVWKDSFSPFNIPNDAYTANVTGGLYSSMWFYNDKLIPTPDLATHWDVSKDNLTVTYYLRKDAKYHDGTPVTAHDVALYFYVYLHPDYKGTRGGGAANVLGYDEYQKTKNRADLTGVKVIDDYTISITAKEVEAPFFLTSNGVAVPRHLYQNVAVADIGTARDPNNANPIGSGPFIWSEYKEGQYIIWKKNPNFYGGEVYIDRVVWKVAPGATQLAGIQQGSLDHVEQVTVGDLDSYAAMSHVKLVEYAGGVYQVMNINNRNFPLSDKRMRQALAYAIDRPAIIQNILKGHASPMLGPIHPLNWSYNDNVNKYERNVARSKQLIEALGFKMGSDGYYQDTSGKRLKLRLNYPSGVVAREQTAPVVQQMLKDVGVEVELIKSDFASMLAVVRDDPKMDWDLSFSGWRSGSPEPDTRQLWGKDSIGPGKSNMAGWTHPAAEEAMQKAAKTLDLEERIENYHKVQEIFAEEVPSLILYATNKIEALNKRLMGYNPNPYSYLWNMDDWWLADGK